MFHPKYMDLEVWQEAMTLVEEVYEVIKTLPKDEQFGLSDQLRRCSVSVPSNIAEGSGRGTVKDYIHFLHTSKGSLYEVATQIELCIRLKYVRREYLTHIFIRIDTVSKKLNGLITHLKSKL